MSRGHRGKGDKIHGNLVDQVYRVLVFEVAAKSMAFSKPLYVGLSGTCLNNPSRAVVGQLMLGTFSCWCLMDSLRTFIQGRCGMWA